MNTPKQLFDDFLVEACMDPSAEQAFYAGMVAALGEIPNRVPSEMPLEYKTAILDWFAEAAEALSPEVFGGILEQIDKIKKG